jgi:hypothetical protein
VETKELKNFIDETMNDRHAPHKRVKTGEISSRTQDYIKKELGIELKDIDADRHGIIHAMKKAAHNLEPDDLLYAVEVINTATDIAISPYKHLSNTILVFKKDIGGGELTILAEIHKKGNYLLVFDAWRQKKARRSPTANMPRANVQDGSPRADTSLSPKTAEKSSGSLPKRP